LVERVLSRVLPGYFGNRFFYALSYFVPKKQAVSELNRVTLACVFWVRFPLGPPKKARHGLLRQLGLVHVFLYS
jgi:hypothetical protein